MAYQVDFGTISKKENSTANGFTVQASASCSLKDPSDLYAPVFTYQGDFPITANYMHVPAMRRYYWITATTFVLGHWEITGKVDVLASFKAEIGATPCYILRSSHSHAGDIPDPLAVAQTSPTINRLADGLGLSGPGSFVVCCAGKNGNAFYMLDAAAWQRLYSIVYTSGFLVDYYNVWDAVVQDVSNAILNPDDYIINAKWVPAPVTGAATEISLGFTNTGVTGHLVQPGTSIFIRVFTWTIPQHPQAATYGTYLNGNMYRKITLHLPGYGNMVLDADALATNATLTITAEMDITGCLSYSVDYAGIHCYVVCDLSCDAGFSVTKSGISNALASIAANPPASLGDLANGVMSAAIGAIPQVERASSGGSRSALVAGQLVICTIVNYTIMPPAPDAQGLPLCVLGTPANYPGYLKIASPSVIAPATQTELDEINAHMERGFFYE